MEIGQVAGFLARHGSGLLFGALMAAVCLGCPGVRRWLFRPRAMGALAGVCMLAAWGVPGMVVGKPVTAGRSGTVLEATRLRLFHQAGSLLKAADGQGTIEDAVREAGAQYGVDPDLIRAVISVESSFRPHAISKSGACGLMQLMPDTYYSLASANPFEVRANVDAGTCYLSMMVERFGDLSLALAAYNVGPGTVDRCGGMPDGARDYVRKVTEALREIKAG